MLPALSVIVAQKLKQRITSCVARFLQKIDKNSLIDCFKLDVYLRNLNDEMLSDIIFFGSDKYKDTVNKEILIHTINFLKTTKRFERPLFLIADTTLRPSFLISLLHSHLFCKHDVITLLAPHQLLQISIFPPIFKQCFTGFRRESAYICAVPHHKRIVWSECWVTYSATF